MSKLTKPKIKAAEDKRKIRQLERDIKKMQKDFDRTFSVMEEKPKKGRRGSVLTAIIAAGILVIAAVLLLGENNSADAFWNFGNSEALVSRVENRI